MINVHVQIINNTKNNLTLVIQWQEVIQPVNIRTLGCIVNKLHNYYPDNKFSV